MAGTEVGSAYLTILPTTKGFASNLSRDLDGPFSQAGIRGGDRLGEGVGRSQGFATAGLKLGAVFATAFAAVGAAQIGGAIKDFLFDAISSASDLNETTSKSAQIFGKSQGKIVEFAKKASSALGQSQQTALDGASTFGLYAKSAGLTGDAVADFATEMVSLAADMASFNNTTPEDAINAIGSALRGENEPIRAYNVLLDDATLRNRALALGLISTTKDALTPQQKVLAAHAEILAQTSVQQGDFARTSGGLANQQRIFTSKLEDTKAEIGTALLPVVTDLFRTFSEVGVPALQDMATWFSENKDVVRDMAVSFVDAGLLILQVFLGFMEHSSRMNELWLTVGTNMVQTWLNVVGAILDGAESAFGWIPGLGPKLRAANDQFDAFRGRVDEQFSSLRTAAEKTTEMFQKGQDAVAGLREKVRALNGTTATVFLNAQGNLTTAFADGSFRVQGGGVGFRASGGPVSAGQPYIVGENSAELFVPGRNGTIYNPSQLAALGGGKSSGGFPSRVTLVDETGSILTHARVIADGAVAGAQRSARAAAAHRGLRTIAAGG